ncbi:unnamed protein product [Rhizophagus irregularis]|uniref:Uncharacterized protein n=1 Tax=Rhizophagus irregularis TaxID=588596 RepID=A0A915YUX3_9GLOM|nr:unnamed protein product [Rhizophagus irregularis]
MTPESFTFFLHVAMYSASEGFAAVQAKKLEDDENLTMLLQQQIKKREELERQLEFLPRKELDYDAIPFQPNLEADDDDLMDDDRDLNINRPIDKSFDVQDRTIAESSGTQPNVDQSLLDHNLNTATPLIVDITQPQHVIQQENMDVDLTKSSKQKKKSNKNLVKNVITGHIPTDDDTSRVRDILVYDIPIPDSMTLAALWTDRRPHSFLSAIKGLKSFKIVQTARGERKLLGFFERWVDMRTALENQVIWENYNLSWNRHAPPTQPTRSHGDRANKNRNRTSRSQKTEKTQQNSKNSKKKPEETTSKKPNGQKNKKDKSRSKSKDKVLAEILDLLRKLV